MLDTTPPQHCLVTGINDSGNVRTDSSQGDTLSDNGLRAVLTERVLRVETLQLPDRTEEHLEHCRCTSQRIWWPCRVSEHWHHTMTGLPQ
ncbi:hypothetical protein ACQP2U_43630 (plasmid) [Nocardia sp. CA-084685]|uniref:hypothetical protein n=1 Tax=Nocardia sp. CA-084685 TaxID=3239970 RepID=UPI003D95E47B